MNSALLNCIKQLIKYLHTYQLFYTTVDCRNILKEQQIDTKFKKKNTQKTKVDRRVLTFSIEKQSAFRNKKTTAN